MTGSTENAAQLSFRNKPGPLLHRINGSISYTKRKYTPLHYNRWQLSPSFGLSYSLSRLIRLSSGYELRTVRPDIDKLNPYADYNDPMNIVKGNPMLEPEKSHNIRLSASYGRQPQTKGIMKIELLLSSINNAIEQLVSTDSEGVSTTSYYNLGKLKKASLNILHMQPGIFKWLDFWQMGQYNHFSYDSSNPQVGTRKTHSLSYDSGIRLTLLPVTELSINYMISTNIESAQSQKMNLYHSLNISLSQVLIKGKLYGSLSLKDPFKYHRYLTKVIGNDYFRQTIQNEQRGYIVGISLRWNFGRFKERIDGETVISNDRTRATIENKLP